MGTAEHHQGADILQPCSFLEKYIPWVVVTGAGTDRLWVGARDSVWVYPVVVQMK